MHVPLASNFVRITSSAYAASSELPGGANACRGTTRNAASMCLLLIQPPATRESARASRSWRAAGSSTAVVLVTS